ncbi:uncharacterized protein LOC131613511 [Vicia villosa]|uniref:uncharacterized protein LOC131613511 n=1 Tax=Vicia villosa TaxID=3911 RepID=UPI00273C7575|nr:uncharacterized protein LOC131613511 [Vicia villosa]
MVGRNDAAIVVELEAMAQALEHHLNVGENAASRNLATFQRENPHVFKVTHDSDGALTCLKEIERIFRVMDFTPDQKVRYGTRMLAVETENWWIETCRRLEASGEEISWVVFRMEFLRKYFPKDVSGKKEIEFLELRQGNKSVVDYAANFEIKKAVSYQKIRVFADLVDRCQICKEDNNAHYRVINEKRDKSQQGRGKPYEAPSGKGKHKVTDGKRTSGGDAPTGVVCFKCGKVSHKSIVCTADARRFFRYGEVRHMAPEW